MVGNLSLQSYFYHQQISEMNNICKFLCLATLCILFTQCNNPSSLSPDSGPEVKAYNDKPSKETAIPYLTYLGTLYSKADNEQSKLEILETSLAVSNKNGMTSKSVSYLIPLLKNHHTSPNFNSHMMSLADIMHGVKKTAASNVLYKSYITNVKEGDLFQKAKDNLTEPIDNLDSFVVNLGTKIFENPDKFGINEKASRAYVDACEAYAMSNPASANAPVYLFKSAEVAKSIRSFTKAINTYDWIIQKYPNYEKTPTSLFLKGFMMENEIGNKIEAKKIYTTFLEKYGSHDLADDVSFLIENLDKSDEEILKMIEEKRKKKQG